MLDIYRKVFSLLDGHERRRALLVFLVMLVIAISEVAGVASIMPFIAVLANPDVVVSNSYLARAYALIGFQSQDAFVSALGAAFFLILVGTLALRALGTWTQLRFTQNRAQAWSGRLIAAYLHQPYEWYLDRHSADLTSSILGEVDTVVNSALAPSMQAIAQCLVAIMLLVMLIVLDPVLALAIGTVLGGGYGAISFVLRKRLRALGEERRLANRARYRVVQETFGGIKDVKIGGLEGRALERFRVPSRVRSQRQITMGLMSTLPSLAMQALLFGGMLLMLLYLRSSYGDFERALPVISLYAFGAYRLMPAVQRTFEEAGRLRSSETALDSLAEDLASLEGPSSRAAPTGAITRLPLREMLEIREASYQYPSGARLALNGVSLKIPAFHSIGLVGATGSGKTTLVDLILGLLRPSAGALVVDGTPLDDSQVRGWQRSLGYVPQQIFLADDSVAGNIAFGTPAHLIDQAAVERAARIANLHDFVVGELPQGYATHVGERGVRLSGGQRQRIGIARALYHDPDVLILDEATSALDNLTEHAVMEAVRNLARKKTIIMIAHRLSTVRHCDCIFMLERGQVVGAGTFDALIASNQEFRQMAASV
jgi:ABC-type multidrug transport system fused ATPase/permease subunit